VRVGVKPDALKRPDVDDSAIFAARAGREGSGRSRKGCGTVAGGYGELVRPPIFLWEPNDLMVFESAQTAERFVEGDTGGEIFDSEGRRLRFEVVGEQRRHPYVTLALREDEDEPTHQAALRELLGRALKETDPEEVSGLALEELVEKAVARFGFAR
jgi:hypothetical protein